MTRGGARIVLAVFLWAGAASLPAMEETIDPLPPDIVRIREAGVLRVAQFEGERPGFFFHVDGERLEEARRKGVPVYDDRGRALVGYDVEMALSLARSLGVDLRIERGYPSFSATVGGVAAGEADIAMTKLSKTLARAVTAELSQPYFLAGITILLNRLREQGLPPGEDEIARLAAGGAVFGVIPGTSQMEWTRSVFPDAAVREYENQNLLFDAVNKGEVTAVLYEEFEAKRFFRLWPDIAINCRMARHPYLLDRMIFASRPGDEGLKRLVDAWLDRRRPLSTDDILDRYESMMVRDAGKRGGRANPGAETAGANMAAGGAAAIAAFLLVAWVFAARPPKPGTRRSGNPGQPS